MSDVARVALALMMLVACLGPVLAEDPAERQPAKTIDELTYVEALGITAARLLSSDDRKQETGRRMTDAIVLSALATDLLKSLIVSPRPEPYSDRRHAFPSGHTSLAFAVASALSENEDDAKWIVYPLAAAAGWARHDLRRHTWEQVVGGAALGIWIGHLTGEGKLRLVGHSDSELSEDGMLRPKSVGPPLQLKFMSTRF